MTKIIGLDIDGVVLNYVKGLMDFAKRKNIFVGCSDTEVLTYCMSNAFPEIVVDQINDLIKEFSTHYSFANISFMTGAVESIYRLVDKYDVALVGITNAGTSPITALLRKENLISLPFDEINVLPLNSSKKNILSKFPKNSIYVDDLKIHVDTATELGHNGILFRQSWNTGDTHYDVVHNWNELEFRIGEILEHDGHYSSNRVS